MHNSDPLCGTGQRNVQRPNALGFLVDDPRRFDHDRRIDLEPLHEPDRHQRDPLIEPIPVGTTDRDGGRVEERFDFRNERTGHDHSHIACANCVEFGKNRLHKAVGETVEPKNRRHFAVVSHRLRGLEARRSMRENPRSERHRGPRNPVPDRQLTTLHIALLGELSEDIVPPIIGPGAGRLGDVADDGHRAVQRAASDHSQLQRRKVLGLVDANVAVRPHGVLVALARPIAEQRSRLVKQRNVGEAPDDLLGVSRTGPVEPQNFVVGKHAVCADPVGRAQERLRTEEIVKQVTRGEDWPHPLKQLAQGHFPAQTLAHRRSLDRLAGTRRQLLKDEVLDDLAAGVVPPRPTTGFTDDLSRVANAETQPLNTKADVEVLEQGPFAIVDRLRKHLHHAKVTLDDCGGFIVELVDPHPRPQQIAEHRDLDTGLAKRWQNLLDVGEEQPVRADNEDALALKGKAVGIKEVGGSMEGDDRFAGAGPALHQQDAGHRSANDLVLLALDRGDDVAEPASARRFDRGDECTLAPHLAFADSQREITEQFIVDSEQRSAAGGEVPPPLDTHGLAPSSPVERLGNRRAPVDDDRILLAVPDAETTDVEGFARFLQVNSAKHEGSVTEVQLCQSLDRHLNDRLAFVSVLFSAASLRLIPAGDPRCALAGVFHARVRQVEIRLLCIEFGMTLGHGLSSTVEQKILSRSGLDPAGAKRLTGTARYPAEVVSIGVVFSAGGPKGDPWHSGVIGALAEHTGFDARAAELLVGTSAGSFTSTALRAGLAPADVENRHLGRDLTPDGQAITGRIVTPYDEPVSDRVNLPSSPKMSLRAMWPPWNVDPIRFAFGLLPNGNRSGEAIATRIDELLSDGWPTKPLWIVAVRTNDGKRIVFGRDDVRGTPGEASQASSAIPALYTPTRIGDREYIDGAVHSSTNADLVAALGFDLVIISSVKTATPETRSWTDDAERMWFSNKLDAEVAEIRSKGTAVMVVEPAAPELAELARNDDTLRHRACEAGRAATERVLAGREGDGIRAILANVAV